MRRLAGIVASCLAVGTGIGIGCAAGGADGTTSGGGGSGGEMSGPGPGHGSVASTTGASMTGGGGGSGPACAKFTAEAKQLPAAMLTVLDMSASMKKAQKYGTAQLAVVNAIDKNVFDSMSLGLLTFPADFTDPPECLCLYLGCNPNDPDFPCSNQTCKAIYFNNQGVSCGVSFLPQVPLAPAGNEKSNAQAGVRHDIYQYLVTHSPLSNSDDGSPIYDSLKAGYNALKSYSIDQRIVILITDGGFSCTSVADPPRPGHSDGACNDWEYPETVNQLITDARIEPNKPIYTFIVGVPGSDSTGAMVDGFATAPYKMRLALSTYAVSGSPDTVDPACDKAAIFTKDGPEPAVPCHIDLSNGAAFDAEKLANAIATIRGKALGCVYDLPDPPPGEMIDPTLVNVNITINGMTSTLKKRSKMDDQCVDEGCWDYNPKGQVEIIGKGCADISAAVDAKVEIFVGCETIVK